MPKNDRILSQSEIDSLLKKIMPSTDEPVSSEQPAPARQVEPSSPEAAIKSVTAEAPFKKTEPPAPESVIKTVRVEVPIKQAEPSSPKEAVQQDSAFISVKPTGLANAKTAETPPTQRSATAASQGPATDEISSLKRSVADLSREVGKLTVALQTVTQLEERVRQLEAMIKTAPDSNGVLKSRIDKIAGILEMLQQKKSDSTLFEEIVCNQCHSKGMVAIYTKCTSCGKENWVGWWPEENNE